MRPRFGILFALEEKQTFYHSWGNFLLACVVATTRRYHWFRNVKLM